MNTCSGSNRCLPSTSWRGRGMLALRIAMLLMLLLTSACGEAAPSAMPPATSTLPPAAAATNTAPAPTLTEPSALPTLVPTETSIPPTVPLPPTPLPVVSSPTPTQEATTSQVMWSIADQRTMVYVPAGAFWMGAADSDPDADPDEKPQHEVTLDAFWIDQYEVTHQEYALCVQAGLCNPPAELDINGFAYEYAAAIPDAPVVNVSWYDARDYCAFADKRLPTEAEWEKAARGMDGRIYPWGDDPDPFHKAWSCAQGCIFVIDHPELYDDFSRPATVGSFPEGVSPYGAYDMAGNVLEWVSDWYAAETYSQPNQVNPTGPDSGEWRVVRGGSWTSPGVYLRSTYRQARTSNDSWIDVGFRCAMEDDPTRLGASRPTIPVTTPVPVEIGELPGTLQMKTVVLNLAWSPDSTRLAVRVRAKGITVWDLANSTESYTLERSNGYQGDMAWSPDGQYIAGGELHPEVHVWDVSTGAILYNLEGHTGDVFAVAWSPDGRWLASAAEDESIIIWDTSTWQAAQTIDHTGVELTDLIFSPDGSRMAASFKGEYKISFWDTTTWELIDTLNMGYRAENLLWSPDGHFLAAQSSEFGVSSVMVWNMAANIPVNEFWNGSMDPSGDFTLMAFSPSGRYLASNTGAGEVMIFDVTNTNPLVVLEGHSSVIWALAWSPDGRYLASGSEDKTVRFWEIADVLP